MPDNNDALNWLLKQTQSAVAYSRLFELYICTLLAFLPRRTRMSQFSPMNKVVFVSASIIGRYVSTFVPSQRHILPVEETRYWLCNSQTVEHPCCVLPTRFGHFSPRQSVVRVWNRRSSASDVFSRSILQHSRPHFWQHCLDGTRWHKWTLLQGRWESCLSALAQGMWCLSKYVRQSTHQFNFEWHRVWTILPPLTVSKMAVSYLIILLKGRYWGFMQVKNPHNCAVGQNMHVITVQHLVRPIQMLTHTL